MVMVIWRCMNAAVASNDALELERRVLSVIVSAVTCVSQYADRPLAVVSYGRSLWL